MIECGICFGEDDVLTTNHGPECKSCREYREYWESLTPAQQREEHLSVARHVQEGIDRGD